LGGKGKEGIFRSKKIRAAFLSDVTHRTRFVYTPKHTSWLDKIELWFSILVRRLLKRASFTSVTDLRQRILDFISYFNRTMAKPFKWTYAARGAARRQIHVFLGERAHGCSDLLESVVPTRLLRDFDASGVPGFARPEFVVVTDVTQSARKKPICPQDLVPADSQRPQNPGVLRNVSY